MNIKKAEKFIGVYLDHKEGRGVFGFEPESLSKESLYYIDVWISNLQM